MGVPMRIINRIIARSCLILSACYAAWAADTTVSVNQAIYPGSTRYAAETREEIARMKERIRSGGPVWTMPDAEVIATCKQAFVELKRPIKFHMVEDWPATTVMFDNSSAHLELTGSAKTFVDRTADNVLVATLWPLLDDEGYAADATCCALYKFKSQMVSSYRLFKSQNSLKKYWP